MAFEGLREQLKDQWADLSSKIQENPTYNNMRERFEELTPDKQKLVVGGVALIVALLLLYIPYSYHSASSENMVYFEENRELIEGLLKASRSAKTPAPLPPPVEAGGIRERMQGAFTVSRLLPEQIGDAQQIPSPIVPESLAPKVIVQNGMAIQLKTLTLKQIVEVGTRLQNLGNGMKFMGMDIVQSANRTHYYDVIVKVVSFGLPAISGDDGGAPAGKGGRRSAPARRRPPSDEAEGE